MEPLCRRVPTMVIRNVAEKHHSDQAARQPLILTVRLPTQAFHIKDELCKSVVLGEKYLADQVIKQRRTFEGKHLSTGPTDLRDNINRDWQNDYADFTVSLKRQLQAIEDGENRKKAISKLRNLLIEYQTARDVRKQWVHP
jgi:hypothetical protein